MDIGVDLYMRHQ